MVDPAPAEAWLRGVHGERSLSKALQNLLLEGFKHAVTPCRQLDREGRSNIAPGTSDGRLVLNNVE